MGRYYLEDERDLWEEFGVDCEDEEPVNDLDYAVEEADPGSVYCRLVETFRISSVTDLEDLGFEPDYVGHSEFEEL